MNHPKPVARAASPARAASSASAAPVTPDALRLEQALQRSEPLARLQRLMQESAECYAAIQGQLPAMLRAHVRPGPLDETGWSLLVANASVAAKLRQLRPQLEDTLRARGWEVSSIRVKVQSAESR